MPIEVNRENIECPKCKSPTIFDVDHKGYFCGTCLTDFDKDMQVKPEAKLPQSDLVPDTMIEEAIQDEQIKIIQEAIEVKEENQEQVKIE